MFIPKPTKTLSTIFCDISTIYFFLVITNLNNNNLNRTTRFIILYRSTGPVKERTKYRTGSKPINKYKICPKAKIHNFSP